MAKNLQSVRGMRDILPEQSASWQYIENIAREIFSSYGYNELRTPIIESTDLFKRSIGDAPIYPSLVLRLIIVIGLSLYQNHRR